tara:strand:+ start:3914 stop:6163 length:2250 start_codon:yes stop_codon:yes gene_type:complete
MATKPLVSFMGVGLAASSSVSWRFTTGTRPHIATFSAHRSDWENTFKNRIGQEGDLKIIDARGNDLTIKNLTILHEVPSSGPNIRSFVIADRRWRWQYSLISRDYNVPKKTGDRTALVNVPYEGFITVDDYDYKNYSLKEGKTVWTAQEALEDVLQQLKNEGDNFDYSIDSFPINESSGGRREFTLQNVVLRDQGDVALSRLLSYVPGATLWVDASGRIRIINGADLSSAKRYFDRLPGATWDGERAIEVDRKAIRPRRIIVHYQREVEVIFTYGDNFSTGTTASDPNPANPYIENVIQTVDDKTTVVEYDPILKQNITKKDLPPGTWVKFSSWLDAMEEIRPADSQPWTFQTISEHWLHGDLDGALGAGGLDNDTSANISMRIQAIKQHFRQSFRINRRLMDRTRDLKNVSAMLLDPYTGTRGPSRVWGQATVIPSKKGERMSMRKDENYAFYYRNVDYYSPTQAEYSNRTTEAPHGPTKVNLVDRDLGIFRLDWIVSPYGTDQSFLPCLLNDESGQPNAPRRDLSKQDDEPMGGGIKVESGTNGIFLADRLNYRVLMTLIPGAPNNKRAYHREIINATDVDAFTSGDWHINGGLGPDLEVFVAPTEATARFAWQQDTLANSTVGNLLGIDKDDPIESGIEGEDLPGYVLVNSDRELYSHSRAIASELFINFSDSIQGKVATVVPEEGVEIQGNMSGVTVQVAAAPSGKVSAMHEFPGVQKPVSRLALMDESARQVVLGIVRFSGGDS